LLKVIDLHCELNGKKVLENVTFSLQSGDFLGIVGPNGAGKTTLLRTLTGILKVKDGNIWIEGKNIKEMSRRQLAQKVAMVPQNTFISFPYTVFEVVLMGRNPYLGRFEREKKEDLEKVEECMRLTQTWELRKRKVTELSGGELQRVVIARTLAQDTPLLLLDEPTAHLDLNQELEIMTLISGLNREGNKTVILVSHNLNLAARYCNKLLLLKEGKVFAKGAVEEVLTEKNIRSVYHLNALVKKHPLTGSVYVLPVATSERSICEERKKAKRGRVHLIGGGGSASRLIKELVELGYEVSIGVVNVFDADFEMAEAFGIACVAEAPFSPITLESHSRNMDLISNSQVVILCNVPFGNGNLLNLKAALWAVKECGAEVIVHNGTPIEKRDYTRGEAKKIFENLLRERVMVGEREEEIISLLEKCLSPGGKDEKQKFNSSKKIVREN